MNQPESYCKIQADSLDDSLIELLANRIISTTYQVYTQPESSIQIYFFFLMFDWKGNLEQL